MCDTQAKDSIVSEAFIQGAQTAAKGMRSRPKSEDDIAKEHVNIDHFLHLVAIEVGSATRKFPSPEALAMALAEEFGEVAKAVLSESWANVRKEAIQCAAMCVRLALEGDPTLDHYRQKNGLEVFRG